MAGPKRDVIPTRHLPQTLTFPQREQTDYLGILRFTPERLAGAAGRGEQIELFLPSSLQISDGVTYENIDMGFIGEGIVSAGKMIKEDGLSAIKDAFSAEGSAEAMETVGALKINELLSAVSPAAGAAGRILSRKAPNPNTRALFKQVNLRNFGFTFKLIPTSEAEARTIGYIITSFRTQLYPESVMAAGVRAGYKFPARYKIEAFYDGKEFNNYHMRTEYSYLTSVQTNYNPSNQAIMKTANGEPFFSEIDIALSFTEGRTLDRKSVEENGY